MITTKTVLVLGAGASANYRYPLGRQLVADMKRLATGDDPLAVAVRGCGFRPEQIQHFVGRVLKSGLPSIDRFLELSPDLQPLGKCAVAARLLECETPETVEGAPGDGEDFYSYLYAKVSAPLLDLPHNSLTVLTFNYDRSLEHALSVRLANTLDLAPEFASSTVAKYIPIHHLHGVLQAYVGHGMSCRPYAATLFPRTIIDCAHGIRIVSDAFDFGADLVFQAAHSALRDATRIVFVGFGFAEENIKRLRPETWAAATDVFGTAIGMEDGERRVAAEMIADLSGRGLGCDLRDSGTIVKTLRHFGWSS